ncbi:ester cyclase [Nonomuraea sp. SMC257]|uniref:Ester cyclase n=1 Tax=Nonomuraea montanisoli TaxID=2741721 RepID=A0A7Y6M4U0_9ACTN|nr:ester cyclase [Nonomuraea montanisoli]NUW33901.1 ester cyclase [Nonomuraea montanisoli]
MPENKVIVRRFYDEVLNAGDLAVADEIVTPGFAPRGGRVTGPEALRETARHLRSAVPDLRFDIEDMIGEGDRVATRWTLRGTHEGDFFGLPATGRPLEVRACVIFRLEDGKVAEIRPVIDSGSLPAGRP